MKTGKFKLCQKEILRQLTVNYDAFFRFIKVTLTKHMLDALPYLIYKSTQTFDLECAFTPVDLVFCYGFCDLQGSRYGYESQIKTFRSSKDRFR